MKRLIALICAFTPFVLSAQPLNPQIEMLISDPVLQNAWWGGSARYTDGETLFSIHADKRMAPASTLKLLTSAAALDEFGPHHRFKTHIYADTLPGKDGVLKGNIYIQGGADPTLGSTRVVGSSNWQDILKTWANAVKKAGITRIEGNLYADVSAFEGPSVPIKVNWENMGNYYAAPASALSINDNSFRIFFKPQPRAGQKTEVEKTVPEMTDVRISSYVTTDGVNKKDNAFVYGAPGQLEMDIFGTIPTNLTGFSINAAMPDPALFALQAFEDSLTKNGISLQGETIITETAPDYSGMNLIHVQYSPELKDIIYIVNKRSFNFYAEMLLRHLALKTGKKGSIDNGITELEKWLKKNNIPADNLKIYDGSGLSRDNMISPNTLVGVLAVMAKHPDFKWYYNSLATPDDRGDLLMLRWFLKPRQQLDAVRLKGGTIDGVKAAAGYVSMPDGRLIVFALMANNLVSKDETINRIHENIIKTLLNSTQ